VVDSLPLLIELCCKKVAADGWLWIAAAVRFPFEMGADAGSAEQPGPPSQCHMAQLQSAI